MATKHLSQSQFFDKLTSLFATREGKDHGVISLSQKRFSATPAATTKGAVDDLSDVQSKTPQPVLIRASNGKTKDNRSKKVKLSTVVQPDELEAFYIKYAEVCKAGMSSLKKRDRKGRKAKKKGKGATAGKDDSEKK